jgi:hypothetical protein
MTRYFSICQHMEFTRNLNVSTAPVMLQIINYKLYDII